MRGRPIPLSIPRRIVTDLMRFSIRVPTAPVHRRMKLGGLMAARAQLAVRPPWTAIFVKAYALVAQEMPELRRVYLSFPWPHLYEYPVSIATVAIEREFHGERAVFGCLISAPESLPLSEISACITHAAQAPTEDVPDFQRAMRGGRLPLPIRRTLMWIAFSIGALRGRYLGTFALTTLAAQGADSTILQSVWTTALIYGPLEGDGSIEVGVTTDHRVLDGATAARVLARLENVLNGPMAQELRGE
jgi:hypothetical protein